MPIQYSIALIGWSFVPGPVACATVGNGPGALSSQGLSLGFIPAALRRRCSTFSKVTLAVAHAALRSFPYQESTPTVFASTHGESEITKSLLVEIANAQQMSPMGFSLSVHNAASGLYSIATGNKAPATAIAAGANTFLMGLCESLMMIHQDRAKQVLFVCSDDLVPSIFLPPGQSQPAPYAFSMLLGAPHDNSEHLLSVTIEEDKSASSDVSDAQARVFATWLGRNDPSCEISSDGSRWRFSIEGASPRECFASPMESVC